MAIQIVWDNPEQTVIREVFDARWTWDDFDAAKTQIDSLIQGVPHLVGLIFDLPANVFFPRNALTHGKKFVDTLHPQIYLLVLASSNTLLRALFDMFKKVYPLAAKRVRWLATVDDAREFLAQTYPHDGG